MRRRIEHAHRLPPPHVGAYQAGGPPRAPIPVAKTLERPVAPVDDFQQSVRTSPANRPVNCLPKKRLTGSRPKLRIPGRIHRGIKRSQVAGSRKRTALANSVWGAVQQYE